MAVAALDHLRPRLGILRLQQHADPLPDRAPEFRATGYGLMNLAEHSCGGFGDWGFGVLRDRRVPLNLIFGIFAGFALLSVVIVLLIKPEEKTSRPNWVAGRRGCR